jgi:hypothetical protein
MGHFSLAGKNLTDVPTWVPDWSVPSPVRRQLQPQVAAGTSRRHIAYDEQDPKVLSVLGVRCTIIKHVHEALPTGLDPASAVNHVRLWQPSDMDCATYEASGERLGRA